MKIRHFLFSISMILTPCSFALHSCEELIGQWQGTWDDLQQIQHASVFFNSIQQEQFNGQFYLENGETGILQGTCVREDVQSGFLIFARTPPFYNPCYGHFSGKIMTVCCLEPNQYGSFEKM